MSEMLKPCPFCGSERVEALDKLDFVACQECGASLEDSEPSARVLWNRRAPSQSSADSADLSELEECGTADAFDDADFAILYREVEDSGTTSLQEITNVSQSFCRLIAGRLRDLNAPQAAPEGKGAEETLLKVCEVLGCQATAIEPVERAKHLMAQLRSQAVYAPQIVGTGVPPSLPLGWNGQHAAKAAWMINTLAISHPDEWLSKAELYETLEEFRALTRPQRGGAA
jgi:Lar family restriction alleviation protein